MTSLRLRLALPLIGLFLAGGFALYIAAQIYGRTAADRSFDRLLLGSALSIAETLSFDQGIVNVDIPYAALEMLAAAPDDRVFYRVIGPTGATVTGYDDLPAPILQSSAKADADQGAISFNDTIYSGELTRFVAVRREIAEPNLAGTILVLVAQTRHARDELAEELVIRAIVPIGLVTVLALGLVWFGIGRALAPLEQLGRAIATREPWDLSPIIAPVPTEAAPLVAAINGFMQRLNKNVEALRMFIAQAAHQMRTPLAALLAQAQASSGGDVKEMRQGLEAVERNAGRLTRLLNQLLSDATVLHRADLRRFEPVDLFDAVQQALHESVPVSGSADVRFETELESAAVTGDGLMIREALKNMIDNAMTHGGGGIIIVRIDEANDSYTLSVSDRGPGIPVQDRDRVLDRFARGSAQAPGAGLGLAIVRDVAVSHGGQITLSERHGGGLVAAIIFPKRTQQ